MDLRDYARILRKHWALIVVCTLLTLGAAAGATLLATPTYTSETQLFVSARDDTGDGIAGAYQGGLFTQQRVKSYADIVDSPTVTQGVVDELDLPFTAGELGSRISASVPLDTVLIDLTVSDESPRQAQQIAAAVAERFTALVPDIEKVQGSATAPVKVTVVKPASLPETPTSPRAKINLALGLLVGLAIGVGGAVLRETLDTSVKGVEELQALTGTTPLGVIAYDPEAGKRPLIVHTDPQSRRAEAFRQLRTNLQFVDVDNPPHAVVVTSAVAEEGKSTTTCNLAISLAQAGAEVVLVEADLRRPRVADYFGIEGAVGLTNVLTSQVAVADVLQPFGRQRLWVLPSGPLPPNPSEILGSQHMRDLLDELTARVDVVVVDTPPLLPVTDAAVLGHITDGVILVVRHGRTRREQVSRSLEALRAADARVLGAVLNYSPAKGPDADAYGYGYGYYETRGDRPKLSASPGSRGAATPETNGRSGGVDVTPRHRSARSERSGRR